MKQNKLIMPTVVCIIIAIIYTILVKTIDVSAIGPNNTEVGFSTLNSIVHNSLGYNNSWYEITKYLGIIPFLIVAFYGIIGLKQLIQKKSIKKVDKRIINLGAFYILLGIVYVFFEKVIINYRPVILDNVLEASYPSSHTMLAICICLTSIFISKNYIKSDYLKKSINYFTGTLMFVIVLGRTLSGVHWISDIIGGIIISIALVMIYLASIEGKTKKR